MTLKPMQFRSFTWPKYPETLTISETRSVKSFALSDFSTVLQDDGKQPKVIAMEGEFCGDCCGKAYQDLAVLFESRESGTLTMPNFPSLFVKPISIVYIGQSRPGLVRYKLEFLEDDSALPDVKTKPLMRYYTVQTDGESLYDIANRIHSTVDDLLACNPDIPWPNALSAGEQVVLP